MPVSPQQANAFSAANGGHTPGDVSTLFASILLVLLFIWGAWLITRALSALYRDNANAGGMDLIWIGLRASALIAIAMWLVL